MVSGCDSKPKVASPEKAEDLMTHAATLAALPLGTILQADVIAALRALPARIVQCVMTSPPYWGLRGLRSGGLDPAQPNPGRARWPHRRREGRQPPRRPAKPIRGGVIHGALSA